MPVKVNNLTINSSVSKEDFSREGVSSEGGNAGEAAEGKALADKKSYLDDACQSAEQIKAEVLAECRQLIKDSIAYRRVR